MTGRRFTIAGVVDRMLAVFSSQGWLMLGLAVLFGGLPRLVTVLIMMSAMRGSGLNGIEGAQVFALFATPGYWIAAVIGWLCGLLASASMTTVAVAAIERRPVSFGESVGKAATKLLPLFLLSIVWTVAVALGLVLLIVPGVMLMVAWMVAWPAIIVEDEGPIEALGRSSYLTKGARWMIFAIILIAGVASAIVSGATRGTSAALFTGAAISDAPIVPLIVNVVVGTLVLLISTVLSSAMYTELRAWKDGAVGGELEEIFA